MANWYVTPNDGDLMHFGILGMKWGVRRYQNADGSLTEAGKKRYAREAEQNEKEMNKKGITDIKELTNANFSELNTKKDAYKQLGYDFGLGENTEDDKHCLDFISKNKTKILTTISEDIIKNKEGFWLFDDPDTDETDEYPLKPWTMTDKQKNIYLKNLLNNSEYYFNINTEKNDKGQRIASGEICIDDYKAAAKMSHSPGDVYTYTMNTDHGLIVPVTINCDTGAIDVGKIYW